MPNWCESELRIEGKKDDVTACLESIKGENGVLDFDKIIPMPEVLKGTESSSNSRYGLIICGEADRDDITIVLSYPWVKEAGVTTTEQLIPFLANMFPDAKAVGEKAIAAKKQTGYADWYEWSNANWGTKWNASEPNITVQRDTCAVIEFSTAWGPPLPVIEALAEKFPNLRITEKFWEGGMGFKGVRAYRNGNCIEESDSEYNGTRGG